MFQIFYSEFVIFFNEKKKINKLHYDLKNFT